LTIALIIDEGNHLIIRRAIGHITLDDIIQAKEETSGHPHFHSGMNVIWDLTQADVDHYSILDVKKLVNLIIQQVAWRGSHYRLAIVAPRDMTFIVSSTFCIICQIENLAIEMRVLRNFRKARVWVLSGENQKIDSRRLTG
jgi:hypothetical protein